MRAIPTRFCGFLILSVYLAGCNSGYKSMPVSAAAQISISPASAMAGSPDFTSDSSRHPNGRFYNSAHNLSQAVWLVNGTDNVVPRQPL